MKAQTVRPISLNGEPLTRLRRLSGELLVERLVDATVDVDVRRTAARNLELDENTEYRAVAVAGLRTAAGRQRFDLPAGQSGTAFHWISPFPGIRVSVVPSAATGACAGTLPLCAGIGPAVHFIDLPSSFRDAVRSLRFTASGSRLIRDPGSSDSTSLAR